MATASTQVSAGKKVTLAIRAAAMLATMPPKKPSQVLEGETAG